MTVGTTLDNLTEPQKAALEALMRGKTVTDAAKAAGVSRQTVSTWRNQDPLFIAALNAAARDQLRHATDSILDLAPAAVAILRDELEAGGETASKAARDVLRFLERIGPAIGATSPTVVRSQLEEEEDVAFMASVIRAMPPLPDEEELILD